MLIAKKQKKTCILVFDGGSHACSSRTKIHEHCIIVYSGYESSADDYIMHILSKEYKGYVCKIITYDRKLHNATALWTTQESPEEFWADVKRFLTLQNNTHPIKKTSYVKYHDENSDQKNDIDELMKQHTKKISYKKE